MANERQIRFGILGCATVARKLAGAISLAPNATISTVASCTAEKAAAFAAETECSATVKIYGSYDAVLDDPDVDAVYIPLPTSLHVRWAVLAGRKKKHVLVEKPVALKVAELDLILSACESSGVQYMDGTVWMHHPRTAKMKDFLSDPLRFGQLKSGKRWRRRRITNFQRLLACTEAEVRWVPCFFASSSLIFRAILWKVTESCDLRCFFVGFPTIQGGRRRSLRVDANNFEIKPSIIQMAASDSFGGSPTEDPNAHIAKFLIEDLQHFQN
ncbi:PREDICTED: uncharacterized oxidoreductase At4g09670-like [Ipomoea nil]|uniref:uncharacterized oxidoreductase At4g09670-like n=1 Tax=Ipomoea nil TaxID=35883 RepID=UPI0009017028|nr:PREDICTED: uncharacterized oxidoreductase At4g09670-like [Ipomoea nil]